MLIRGLCHVLINVKEVKNLSNISEDYIEEYIRSLISTENDKILEIEKYAHYNHIPIIEKEVAQFLKVLLKIAKPKRILEIGTAIGYSAIVMASSTDDFCRITTIERRSDMIELAKENLERTGYAERVNIICGEAEEILLKLKEKYDFIFLDASKGHYLKFFNRCVELLNDRGIIMADNVLYKGMVASDELVVRRKRTIVKRMREYLKHIHKLDGYESCVIPIGDGVSLTYREERDICINQSY